MRLQGVVKNFVKQHRPAAMIVAAAVAALVVWRVVLALSHPGAVPAPATTALRPATPTPPAASSPAAPNAGAAAGAAAGGRPGTGPAATGGGAAAPAPDASRPAGPGTGRPDPFSPLAGQTGSGGSAASGGGGNPALPPVPPLSPGALGPGASAAGGGEPGSPDTSAPLTQFRLTGIVAGQIPVAILNDAASSYIVEPGDTVVSGVRLVAVDAGRRSVTLSWNEQSWQLQLPQGGTSR